MNRHTFNANADMLGDAELFFWTVNHWKPDHLFMMGGENAMPNAHTRRAYDLVRSWGGTLHYRPFSNHEGHLWKVRSPRDHVALLKSYNLPGAVFNVGNEPIPNQEAAAEMSNWYAELFRIAREEGIQVSGPGFATATYQRSQLVWFDKMFKAIAQYDQWLNVHVYTHALVPWGAAGRDPNDLLYPERVQKNRWPTRAEMMANLDINYLVFREEQMVDRIRVLTGKTPKVVITECFLDRMPNFVINMPQLTAALDAKAGQQIYGLPTLYKYWQFLFPQWSPEQAVYEQMNWAEEVYPSHYKAFCWFTWSSHNDHPYFWSSRYGWQHNRKLLEGWPSARKVSVQVPVTITPQDGSPITATAKAEKNYRSDTVVTPSTLLGTFKPGTTMLIWPKSRTSLINGYVWIKAQIGTTVAWVTLTAGLFPELDAYDNQPQQPTQPGEIDLSNYVRKDELEALIAQYMRKVWS